MYKRVFVIALCFGLICLIYAKIDVIKSDAKTVIGTTVSRPVIVAPKSPDVTIISQNFEGGVMPPTGWTQQIQNASYTWQISTVYFHTGTYGALSPWDYNLDEKLISPVINLSTYPPGTPIYLSFWWEGSYYWYVSPYNNGTFSVDVTTNGTNWTTIWDEETTYAWSNFTWYDANFGNHLDLSAYAGQPYFQFRFRNLANDNADVGLDDILLYANLVFTNDVGVDAILSPGAYHTPNTLMTPSASVKNYGTATQTNFQTVCSIVGAGLSYTSTKTVASLAGGATTTVNFDTLRPTTTGICTVKIRTNLTTDENSTNDRKTKTCNISNITFITIGTGTSTQRQPLGMYWGYERSAGLYLGSEIGNTGTINEIAWFISALTTAANGPVKIYLNTTASATLTAMTWDAMISGATLVYDGTPTFVAGDWFTFAFTAPFSFTNTSDNLLVLVETNYGGTGGEASTAKAIYYSTAASQHEIWYADNTPPASSGTVNANRPNVRLAMTTTPPPPSDVGVQRIITPIGSYQVSTPITPSAVVKNYGTATQTNFQVACSIIGPAKVVRYANHKTIASLAAGDTTVVVFDIYTPNTMESESVFVRTLVTDANPANDRKSRAILIHSYTLMEGFNDALFPPPGWDTTRVTGTSANNIWSQMTSGTNPTCTPIEGSGMARYYAYLATSGNQSRLRSPAINLGSTPRACTLKFYMTHDPGYTSNDDRITVQTSTDGTNFTDLITISRYAAAFAWTEHPVFLGNLSGVIYFAFLATSAFGDNMFIDDVRLQGGVGIEEVTPNKIPIITLLNAVKPNPVSNGIAHISFSIAEPTKASLKIYDASGRMVKTLANSSFDRGVYNLTWNGTDDNNNKVAEGIYFYTLTTDNNNYTKKLVFTR